MFDGFLQHKVYLVNKMAGHSPSLYLFIVYMPYTLLTSFIV